MEPAPPNPPPARFARLMAALCEAVAARLATPTRAGLAGPFVILLWTRLRRMADRVARLAARAGAGRLAPPRRRPARKRPAAAPPYQRLPGGFAWLVRAVPASASSAAQLRHLLEDPAMTDLIRAAPQLGRTLRPLCRMLGVDSPPILRRTPVPRQPPSPPRRAQSGQRPPSAAPCARSPRPHRPPSAPEVAARLPPTTA